MTVRESDDSSSNLFSFGVKADAAGKNSNQSWQTVPPQALFLLAFMWGAYFLNYCDRQAVFSMFPALKADLQMSARPDRHNFPVDLRLGMPNRRAAWRQIFKTKTCRDKFDNLEPCDDRHGFRKFRFDHAQSPRRDGDFGIPVHAHRDCSDG